MLKYIFYFLKNQPTTLKINYQSFQLFKYDKICLQIKLKFHVKERNQKLYNFISRGRAERLSDIFISSVILKISQNPKVPASKCNKFI